VRQPVVPDSKEREAGEKGYCSPFLLCYLFFRPLYSVLFPFLLSPAPIFHSLSPWFCQRLLPVLLVAVERKKQRWFPGDEDGSSSSICRDCSLYFSLPTSAFAFFCFFFVACFPLFSKKFLIPLFIFLFAQKSPPLLPIFCFPSCIYRHLRGRFTIPCPSAGHGGMGWLLCNCCRAPSSWW